ncbi:MSMEG_4193 family putative phosphomutase [Naumannella halotolerans]|uniref:MSMEG_4193 family putative phosphomutase n=1 Tax=Naumannella halotolerans TaxID=993414 RepID=UPI00370DD733
MTTVLLVRHGRSTANTARVLAGRSPGVHLDDHGRAQAEALGEALIGIDLAAAVSSPMERCRETTELLLRGRDVELSIDEDLTECDYGQWTNRLLSELSGQPLWKRVQSAPSSVTFPEGEAMQAMAARGVQALRRHDRRIAAAHGDHAIWLAVSHGDVIKAILADALGMHLDHFQRISVAPAALSILAINDGSLRVLTLNAGTDLAALVPRAPVTEGTPGGDVGAEAAGDTRAQPSSSPAAQSADADRPRA